MKYIIVKNTSINSFRKNISINIYLCNLVRFGFEKGI